MADLLVGDGPSRLGGSGHPPDSSPPNARARDLGHGTSGPPAPPQAARGTAALPTGLVGPDGREQRQHGEAQAEPGDPGLLVLVDDRLRLLGRQPGLLQRLVEVGVGDERRTSGEAHLCRGRHVRGDVRVVLDAVQEARSQRPDQDRAGQRGAE
jgi:hypothetical protein